MVDDAVYSMDYQNCSLCLKQSNQSLLMSYENRINENRFVQPVDIRNGFIVNQVNFKTNYDFVDLFR